MKRAFIAVLALLALASFAMPATAAQYDGLMMDVSQTYMRLGFNDTIVLTLHLTDGGAPTGIADKSVALSFRTGGDYVIFGNEQPSMSIATNSSGIATATIRLNPENQPGELPPAVAGDGRGDRYRKRRHPLQPDRVHHQHRVHFRVRRR